MVRVDRAFCNETRSVLNIFEARDYFFSRPSPRVPLTFSCSDPNCRNSATPPTISGINHHVALGAGMKHVRPHFRSSGNPHSPNCDWSIGEEAVQQLQHESTPGPGVLNVCLKFRYAKTGDIIDVFRPAVSEDEVVHVEEADEASRKIPIQIASQEERVKYLKASLRRSPHTTCRLELLVHSYLSLTQNETKTTYLKIGEKSKPYNSIFWHSMYWKEGSEPRVNFGYIRRVERDGNTIRFHLADEVRTTPNSSHPAWIELDTSSLKQQRGWKTFEETLLQAEKTKCQIYTFGSFERSKGGYVCYPRSMSNLCIIPYPKVVALKPSKKPKNKQPGIPGR